MVTGHVGINLINQKSICDTYTIGQFAFFSKTNVAVILARAVSAECPTTQWLQSKYQYEREGEVILLRKTIIETAYFCVFFWLRAVCQNE